MEREAAMVRRQGKVCRMMANYTKEERAERWRTCIIYLKRAGNSIPAAKRLAKTERSSAGWYATSVWITALSKALQELTQE